MATTGAERGSRGSAICRWMNPLRRHPGRRLRARVPCRQMFSTPSTIAFYRSRTLDHHLTTPMTATGLMNQPCPWLPEIDRPWPARELSGPGRAGRAADLCRVALCCAQWKWLAGQPGQALLMLNRVFALGCPRDPGLSGCAWLPYRAVGWILRQPGLCGFIGNPRRHFQHLATRMPPGSDADVRIWRAWACWALACQAGHPEWVADVEQLRREHISEPGLDEVAAGLTRYGVRGEADLWGQCLDAADSA